MLGQSAVLFVHPAFDTSNPFRDARFTLCNDRRGLASFSVLFFFLFVTYPVCLFLADTGQQIEMEETGAPSTKATQHHQPVL